MPRPTAALLVLPLTALLLAGCGDDGDTASPSGLASEVTEAPATTPATTPASPSAAGSPAPPSPTVEAFDGTEVSVAYAGGVVSPAPGEVEVELGSKVRITITSDVPEEYHVHTYDLQGPITPGSPTQVEFVAEIPGQHEVELHDSGDALLELVVR